MPILLWVIFPCALWSGWLSAVTLAMTPIDSEASKARDVRRGPDRLN